ncbi:MAG: hypothetical protein K6T86_08460 [Pirellulales bacterium]|jgi:hypothetical protein|nr:hypothetical protein [Pirellulales bacterium]
MQDEFATRVRAVFKLGDGDPLPPADEEAHIQWHEYLTRHLVFPFEAEFCENAGHLAEERFPVVVERLLGPEDGTWYDEQYGLLCEAQHKRQLVSLPLVDVHATGRSPNRMPLRDYAQWLRMAR